VLELVVDTGQTKRDDDGAEDGVAEIRTILTEAATLVVDPGLLKALDDLAVAGDEEIASAEADPSSFLKTCGVTVPPIKNIALAIRGSQARPDIVPRIEFTVCFKSYVTIFRNTKLERKVTFESCNTYYIW